ncbi:DUF2085 domain-containing protein [Aminipila butyrica]|uniref:DUF2085 domain-containing protein n=1 Tax=Aminipila butyrica TaxID=433296 RepID=A0A858BUD0_9FIRM|nr:DUF2085 domain-containing protein [Aminipila butyrica]QIB68688.1 DUF2085 domain-containing protein [Aminipila butyrica]
MTGFFYRWLPIFFGCHCRAERSFFLSGKQFPICARCTGELVGILLLGITYGLYHPPILYAAILLIPMILDGGIQLLTSYESTNVRRFLTGLLFGYGFFHLFLTSIIATYWYGYHFI